MRQRHKLEMRQEHLLDLLHVDRSMSSLKIRICLVMACCAPGWAMAQIDSSSNTSQTVQARSPVVVRVRSNLVVVPVFVYVPNGIERNMTKQEFDCEVDDWSAFQKLKADQPYLPPDCRTVEITDLTLADFSLFEDGKEQRLRGVSKASWRLTVRDASAGDRTSFHFDFSDTPSGQWSTTDIIGLRSNLSEHLYLLSYVPDNAPSTDGCHRIRVKVRRPKVEVFAKDEYCTGQTTSDLLNGTKEGRDLEHELSQKGPGKIPLFLEAGTLHSGASKDQRVDVVVKFPWNLLHHSWEDTGKFDARIGILGVVHSEDGEVAARFSDLLYPSWWPAYVKGWRGSGDLFFFDELSSGDFIHSDNGLRRKDPAWLPTRYETQLELPPGKYTLRVVLSDGVKFGRAEEPLTVENGDHTSLSLSSVFLSTRYRDAHVADVETKAANFAPQYTPLVSKGVRFTPAADTRFTPDQPLIAYFEIYKPQNAALISEQLQAHLRIVNAMSGVVVKDFPAVNASSYRKPGSTVISIAREIPISDLPSGRYRLEVQVSNSDGHETAWRAAEFGIIERTIKGQK